MLRFAIACVTGFLVLSAAHSAEGDEALCGYSPSDWCASPAGDPCGRHRDQASCKADPACFAMPYRGELVIACILDARGFASNCPAVGCTSVPPAR